MIALILAIVTTMSIIPEQAAIYVALENVGDVFSILEQKKQREEICQNIILELNRKYGNGNFEIVSVSNNENYGLDVYVESSYLEKDFYVFPNFDGTSIVKDNFIELYAKEKWEITDIESYAIEKAIELEKEKIPKEYDIEFNYENTMFNKYYEYEKGREPIIEDLIEMVNIKVENDAIVGSSYTKNDLEKFSAHMCDICRIYIENYARDEWDDAVWFEFENGVNPYQNPEEDKLGAYKDGGHVKNAGPYWTLLYLNPKPLQIKK